ncbi:MAG TPA: response regulator [Phototrophicaceae bacterium]|nr:response regulator [Phototrophicaceae bacterium]
MTSKPHNGSAVPRYQVIVLSDGNYAIQWTESSVQDLLTGEYREYKASDLGHRLGDAELDQLKKSGVIEDYDHAFVWVYALPEDQRFGGLHTIEQSSNRVRAYYINTTLPANHLADVQASLAAHDLAEDFAPSEHEGLVALLNVEGVPFYSLKDAESALRKVQAALPDLASAALAFTENDGDFVPVSTSDDGESIDLDALIASQTDTSVTRDKSAVVACKDDFERHAIMRLLRTMEMKVVGVDTAQKALNLLEEAQVDLVVMDVRLDDMHGWAMIGKAREIGHAGQTHFIVLADPGADDQVFALTVANVDAYLRKPISIAHLRQSVWSVLKEHSTE